MSANYRDREIAFAIAELSCQNADELDEWAEAIASYREEIERNVLTNSAPPCAGRGSDADAGRDGWGYGMREIKFRAWNTKTNGWVVFKGALPFLPNEPFSIMDLTPLDAEIIIEQYTGLRDAKGKEIYEGDVVRDGFDSVRTIKWFDNLGYDGGGAMHSGFYFDETYDGIGELNYHNHVTDCEVIGNIHENPELLDVKRQLPREKKPTIWYVASPQGVEEHSSDCQSFHRKEPKNG
jgi:hypothetical protein